MYKSILKPSPPFIYAISEQTALAAGGSVTPAINISNDCDFELIEIRAVVHKAAVISGSLMMQMSLSSGELFSNVAIDLLSFAQTYQTTFMNQGYPIRLPVPIRIPKSSVINVQLTNNNAEAIARVQVQLVGYKVDSNEVIQ